MKMLKRFALAFLVAIAGFGPAVILPARATVNNSISSVTVLGDGATTQFSFPFIGVAAAYISVTYTDASGNQTVLTQGTGSSQFQVSLNPAVAGSLWGVGGTIIYAPGGTPIAAGTKLTISRTLPFLQAVSLQNQATAPALGKSSEQAIDELAMQLQQTESAVGRAIVANASNSAAPAPLPPAAQAANYGLCFDGTGNNVIACASLPTGTVSSAMQPVVNAASLAAGRTAFGIGALGQEGIGAGLQDDGAGNARVNASTTPDATNTTVTAAFHQTVRVATGPFTYTLPRADTLWNGFTFTIVAKSGSITLAINPADAFIGQASGASFTVPAGYVATISTDAATSGAWFAALAPQAVPAVIGLSPVANGLVIKNNAGSPNTKIDVTASSAVLTSSAGASIFWSAGGTETCDLTVNGAGGLDTGTKANSTWYNLYLIYNSATSTPNCLASTSATSPTLPSGYTYDMRVGAMYVNSGGNLNSSMQFGHHAQYTSAQAMVSYQSSSSWQAVAVAAFVPPTANEIFGTVEASYVSGAYAAVAPNGSYSSGSSLGSNAPYAEFNVGAGTSTFAQAGMFDMLLESRNIYWNGASAYVYCRGWADSVNAN